MIDLRHPVTKASLSVHDEAQADFWLAAGYERVSQPAAQPAAKKASGKKSAAKKAAPKSKK